LWQGRAGSLVFMTENFRNAKQGWVQLVMWLLLLFTVAGNHAPVCCLLLPLFLTGSSNFVEGNAKWKWMKSLWFFFAAICYSWQEKEMESHAVTVWFWQKIMGKKSAMWCGTSMVWRYDEHMYFCPNPSTQGMALVLLVSLLQDEALMTAKWPSNFLSWWSTGQGMVEAWSSRVKLYFSYNSSNQTMASCTA
jgi:hypothetical protein